jgi:large subunit ribosomal protein L9
MQLLLLEDYPALGYVGDTVQVKNGHARNFLIPQGIGIECSSRRAKEFEHLMKGVTAKRARLKSDAESLGSEIAKEKLSFELKVGSGGRAFGSITSRDILKKLEERGYSLEKKQVRLHDPIKTPGEHVAEVQLHGEVTVELSVEVVGIKDTSKDAGGDAGDKKASGSDAEAEVPEGEDSGATDAGDESSASDEESNDEDEEDKE